MFGGGGQGSEKKQNAQWKHVQWKPFWQDAGFALHYTAFEIHWDVFLDGKNNQKLKEHRLESWEQDVS